MKIFLDDIRYPKTNDWVIVRNAKDAIDILDRCYSLIDEISYDHDLGNDSDGTGYDVAKYIEERCFNMGCKCPKWNIHSANPVGIENIQAAMMAAKTYSKEN